MDKVLLEVCCGSADDVIEAYKAGADRVELNSDLFHGGLTPTVGSLKVAKERTGMKIIAMIRPREGGFCYTDAEFDVCRCDAVSLLDAGADGIVFGFLNADGTVDKNRTKEIADIALIRGKEAVFHRAIDVVPDWKSALDELISIGITRVLTSGQESDVMYGTDTVREMIDYAAGRITILPGAGITLKNAKRIVSETGAKEIHVAAYRHLTDMSTSNNRSIYYGGCLYPSEERYNIIDCDYIKGVRDEV